MKTAFTYWDNRIAPVFDIARQVRVVESDDSRIVGVSEEILEDGLPVRKVINLAQLGVATLVCGAISRPLHAMVVSNGIQVVPFVAGDLGEVIQAWFEGTLDDEGFAMPGCCGRGYGWKPCCESGEEQVMSQGRGGDKGEDRARAAWADPKREAPSVSASVQHADIVKRTNAERPAHKSSARSAALRWQGNNRQIQGGFIMPGRDGTGPMGSGPTGGRRFGNCAGQVAAGQGFGRGLGQGGGRGRGRTLQAGTNQEGGRFGFNASERSSAMTMENQELMRQNETLRSEMEVIMKRLDEMEARTVDSK
ncbi:MAG: DUF5320 family protein [Desulfuromonadales bacterium]|nr:DUF5320 family protein [Desulfuromonadales bacterium]